MSIENFLIDFQRHAKRYKWYLNSFGYIRTKKLDMCPMACLVKSKYKKDIDNSDFDIMEKLLKLTTEQRGIIISATDSCRLLEAQKLRKKLLRITGLK